MVNDAQKYLFSDYSIIYDWRELLGIFLHDKPQL